MPRGYECNFCSPNEEEITSLVPFSKRELEQKRDQVEMQGLKLGCDKSEDTCIPLKLIQHRIDRLIKGLK